MTTILQGRYRSLARPECGVIVFNEPFDVEDCFANLWIGPL